MASFLVLDPPARAWAQSAAFRTTPVSPAPAATVPFLLPSEDPAPEALPLAGDGELGTSLLAPYESLAEKSGGIPARQGSRERIDVPAHRLRRPDVRLGRPRDPELRDGPARTDSHLLAPVSLAVEPLERGDTQSASDRLDALFTGNSKRPDLALPIDLGETPPIGTTLGRAHQVPRVPSAELRGRRPAGGRKAPPALRAAGLRARLLSAWSALTTLLPSPILSPLLATQEGPADKKGPPAVGGKDVARMLDLTRRLLVREDVRKFLKETFKEELELPADVAERLGLPERQKEMSESQFLLLLGRNPDSWDLLEEFLKKAPDPGKDTKKAEAEREEWDAKFRRLIEGEGLKEEFRRLNDPLEPLPIESPDGGPGYRDLRVFANHRTFRDGAWKGPDDLKAVLLDFIHGAEKELMVNVFDFDLMEVAEALVERAEAGVQVWVGIDDATIEERPEVQAVAKRLKGVKGLHLQAVDAVGLNHQKLVTRDWSMPRKAGALFSSGNFTQSCIGPEGDLVGVPRRPDFSVPNANHMIVMDGQLPALLVAHQLTKTIHPDFLLRGDAYPLGGAFKVFGEAPSKGGERPFFVITFSPKGGLGDVNRDVLQQVLLRTRGPIRLMQFAFSSPTIEEALLERAKLEKEEGRELDLKGVGDTPFAMAFWSVFLSLSGYEVEEKDGVKRYVEKTDTPLRKLLGPEAFARLRGNLRTAPRAYSKRPFTLPDGTSKEVTAKLHHKVLLSGEVAVAGTSFNFSESANSNNEQILVFKDPAVAAAMEAIFEGLFRETDRSIEETARLRNEKSGYEEDSKPSLSGRLAEEEGRRSHSARPGRKG